MKIILKQKNRRKRPPNPAQSAAEMTDRFNVLINRQQKKKEKLDSNVCPL